MVAISVPRQAAPPTAACPACRASPPGRRPRRAGARRGLRVVQVRLVPAIFARVTRDSGGHRRRRRDGGRGRGAGVAGQGLGARDAGVRHVGPRVGLRIGLRVGRPRQRRSLFAHQPVIQAALAHQFGMAAGLDHAALVQHQAAVGADHAGQPVRQDQRAAAFHQPVQRLLDQRFVLGVDRGQRLVQDQDGRVAQQRAGDRQALALAAGQLQPAFTDAGGVAVGQRHNEVVDVGGAGGAQLLAAGVGAAQAQVVLDGAVEQHDVLAHQRDLRQQRVGVELVQVMAAHAHRAGLRHAPRSSRRTMVDLPAPLGPTTPTRSPAAMRKLRPWCAGRSGV